MINNVWENFILITKYGVYFVALVVACSYFEPLLKN